MNPPNFSTPPEESAPRCRRILRGTENSLVVLALAVMAVLPVAEIVLRKFFQSGIPASTAMVQHLVLVIAMVGGGIAARDDRLLSLGAAKGYLKGRALAWARVFSYGFAAAVSAGLCVASWQFVAESRSLGNILAYGVPVWVVESLMIVGFGLIALRLVWNAAPQWKGRALALSLAAGFVAVAVFAPGDPANLRWPAIILLLAAIAGGAPIFTALGGAAMILLWTGGESIASVPLKFYGITVNPMLPTIPLFTLAGFFLAEGGTARRLVRVFQALFGNLRGGPAVVTALTCAFFTCFTGASGVTILALGGLLMPVLIHSRYRERDALGLITGAGSLGLLFPPCLPPILYAYIASSGGQTSVSMQEMYEGGLLPGLLLVGLTAWWGLRVSPRRVVGESPPFNWREAGASLWAAKWEILIPVVALGALFGGVATPVEAAALTACYTFIVEVFIYRDLKLTRDVPRVMTECGELVGGVKLIVGVALGFTYFLIWAQVPDAAVDWATRTIHSKWVFLLALNGFLLLVGCLMDIFSAIIVVVPLIVPVANVFGIDPIHLGVIFLANLELGYLAPPLGMNLFLSSLRFKKPIGEVARATLPMAAVLAIGVLLITYVPALTTWLPHFLAKTSVPTP